MPAEITSRVYLTTHLPDGPVQAEIGTITVPLTDLGIPEADVRQQLGQLLQAAGTYLYAGGALPSPGVARDQGVPLPTVLQLAQTAYAAYGEATGGVNYQGPMPAWDDLGDTIQRAWIGAAAAVRDEVLPPSGADQDHGMRIG